MTTLLVADIGGTKSELALFPLSGGEKEMVRKKRYANADFSCIEEILDSFLSETGEQPEFACLAVAGLVSRSKAQMTNLPWRIDCRLLEARFGWKRALVLNDLTALSSSLALLQPGDLLTIQAGDGLGGEVRGILAPGTGLGEGFVVQFAGQQFVRGSEGGHTDFAPVDNEQLALLTWMRQKVNPVSYETLIAGPGLVRLYDFFRDYQHIPESAWVAGAMAGVKDRVPVIVAGAAAGIGEQTCPLCRKVIELFLSILGSEAANLALKLYARGGIYLGGGILPRLIGKVDFAGFLKAFQAKGQMSGLLQKIPIYLIIRNDAALLGAAHHARVALSGRISGGN